MDATDEMYLMVDSDLLVRLMQRTGTGSKVTVRELAEAAGVHPSTIGFLRTGAQRTAPRHTALAIANRLGVDPLVLWAPVGRSVPAPDGEAVAV
ncbi:helix-turn-helix domain-containing protein [Streptomyces sp. CA-146814]|uniref:helix-turn-helix domain-containing protein n=1 Tax=Streptomyces sp. CA-146814 TaxID=3240053 RepID=UPI003D911B98